MQIEALLTEKDASRVLPSGLSGVVDAIRKFGNFSAHPITDVTTSQIIDVEPDEAEWCLEIIEQLFDHYYARPAAAQLKLEALNEKLEKAGKPSAKSKPDKPETTA